MSSLLFYTVENSKNIVGVSKLLAGTVYIHVFFKTLVVAFFVSVGMCVSLSVLYNLSWTDTCNINGVTVSVNRLWDHTTNIELCSGAQILSLISWKNHDFAGVRIF